MTQIAYFGLFWTQFRVSRDLFTDLTAGKVTVQTFLPRLLTAASRIQNCTYRKTITYQTPQSNLPSANLNWNEIYQETDMQLAFSMFYSKLLHHYNTHFPPKIDWDIYSKIMANPGIERCHKNNNKMYKFKKKNTLCL